MIIVNKNYYYIDEVYNYCLKNKDYKYFLSTLEHLKNKNEIYISAAFFYDALKNIKQNLTDLTGYFNIKYFHFDNIQQMKKTIEYFDYKIPKYCQGTKAIHLYNKEIIECIKQGYTVNFLGYFTSVNGLRKRGIIPIQFNKIIILKNKNKNNNKKMYLGAWK